MTAGAGPAEIAIEDFAGVGVAVMTPAHQYPTGTTLHPQRRHAVAERALACAGLVIEDDYNGESRYDRHPSAPCRGVTGIAAGLHVMIGLPAAGPSEDQVLARASARGLAIGGLAGS